MMMGAQNNPALDNSLIGLGGNMMQEEVHNGALDSSYLGLDGGNMMMQSNPMQAQTDTSMIDLEIAMQPMEPQTEQVMDTSLMDGNANNLSVI